jgi:hypothetical protein
METTRSLPLPILEIPHQTDISLFSALEHYRAIERASPMYAI